METHLRVIGTLVLLTLATVGFVCWQMLCEISGQAAPYGMTNRRECDGIPGDSLFVGSEKDDPLPPHPGTAHLSMLRKTSMSYSCPLVSENAATNSVMRLGSSSLGMETK